MNLYEIAEKYHLSLAKLRRMKKAGVLRLDSDENDNAAKIRLYLSRGQHLTLAHLLALLEEPSIRFELGRYADRADEQLRALGDVRNGAAPPEVAAYCWDAATGGNLEAVEVVVNWLRSVIPTEPVSHYWVALRLLWGVPQNIRHYDVPRIPLTLLQCRKHQAFTDWWRTVRIGSRTQTLYQRPKKLFDL